MNSYGFQLFLLLIYFLHFKLLFDFFFPLFASPCKLGPFGSYLVPNIHVLFGSRTVNPPRQHPWVHPLGHRAGSAPKYQFGGVFLTLPLSRRGWGAEEEGGGGGKAAACPLELEGLPGASRGR